MAKRKKSLGNRVGLIDEVRGISIILMIIYHLFFDLVFIFGVKIDIFNSTQINLLRDMFAGLFIFISGTSCRLSHNNLKRGIICFCFGMVLTLVTWIFVPNEIICFGILHMLGISMIIYHMLEKILSKIKFPIIGILISVVFFWFTLGILNGTFLTLPKSMILSDWLFPIGITSPGFSSSDYFPLIPWIFIFIAGSYFGVYVIEKRLPEFFYNTHSGFLAYVGRYTLVIYLLHQIVIYGILYVIFYYIIPFLTQQTFLL